MDNYFKRTGVLALSHSGGLCFAASEQRIAPLTASAAISTLGPARLLELKPSEPLPRHALDGVRVLVLEVAAAEPASVRRIRTVRADYPDLKIIAAIAEADVALVKTLVRQGIRDVAELPFAADELAAQILELWDEDMEGQATAPLAPLFTVVRSVGGSGSTSVLTHLAAALVHADTSGRGVCVVDFDIQGGDVAAYVGTPASVSLAELLGAGDRLDDALIASTALESRYGFTLVAAPDAIMPLDIVSPEEVAMILTSLRQRYGYVLVDLPADWCDWSMAIATVADRLLMVTDTAIASLRQGRRKIDLLESVGVDRSKIKVIANHVERRFFRTIKTDDIAQALRADVVATLSEEGAELRSAQDQGLLLSDTVGRDGYVKAIDDLAARLIAGEM